jgi:hypothetical protein
MKRTLMMVIAMGLLGAAPLARAADEPKPDCGEKQQALDDAKASEKSAAAKPDLSPCKDLKGPEKKSCEDPIKEKSKADEKAAKDGVKAAKTALECCKKPDKKGCAP